MNVVLDYVANHMHINSPTLQAHPDWHTDSILPDGRRNFELWDEARLTTWFDTHIPSLDLERPEVCEAMTDSALYWLENYALDGFRHDACKHIPEGYWRMLGQKIATRWPGRAIWMIGETYGSPELIGSYVKSGMLDAQFDFNVYFTAREALCGLKGMDEVLNNELTSLRTYGAHHAGAFVHFKAESNTRRKDLGRFRTPGADKPLADRRDMAAVHFGGVAAAPYGLYVFFRPPHNIAQGYVLFYLLHCIVQAVVFAEIDVIIDLGAG